LEWENIFSGRYTDDQIMNLRHKLMKLQHEVERTLIAESATEQAANTAKLSKCPGSGESSSAQERCY
jgi:hypothetical protein